MKHLAGLAALSLAACTDTAAPTTFDVSGKVTTDVTHVVATTPDHIATSRIAVPVGADGRFTLPLEPGHAWVVAFADARKTGAEMLVGTLQVGMLDELSPQTGGSLDLGAVSLSGDRASTTLAYSELIAALGIDSAEAGRLGKRDDLALRYANPDIDGDGVLDALQPGFDVRLSLHSSYLFASDTGAISIDGLIAGSTVPVGVAYEGTAIEASVPGAMVDGVDLSLSTVTFQQMFYGSVDGPDTAAVPAGFAIGEPHMRSGMIDGMPTVGVAARPGHDLPFGAYAFAIGDRELAFTHVAPPSDASLGAHDAAFPMPQIVPTEAGCTTACAISSINYAWSAQDVSPARIDVVLEYRGTAQHIGFPLTDGALSGTFSWQLAASAMRMSYAELAGITTSNICYVSVTFGDELGVKRTASAANPACF